MKKLQFDHNEVINELIESSQKSSINDDGSNSKKVEEGLCNFQNIFNFNNMIC